MSVPLRDQILTQAQALGFTLAGITTLGPAETVPYFETWLNAHYAGEMTYLHKGAEKRTDTRLPYPGATTAIVVALNYGGQQPPGPIARYARSRDYHDVITQKLTELHIWLSQTTGKEITGKAYVDTGPILERDLARRAGLGWFGKNTNLIHPKLGSFFFIAALLVDLDLAPSPPFTTDHCGTCTRCLDACPTGALVSPHTLDATKCISYLTIELRGPIPKSLRSQIGDLIYGCDICQDVCPWNQKFSQPVTDAALTPNPAMQSPSLTNLMQMSDESWRSFAKGSPIKRTKRRGFLRNVAIALGNQASRESIPALTKALTDSEPLIRAHAAWALGKIGTPEALDVLRVQLTQEEDAAVLEEIQSALPAL